MKVRSIRGREVDMSALSARNETKKAIGNANMNARGDEVDSQGRIVRDRAQIARDYYATNPNAVKTSTLNKISAEILTPEQAVKKAIEQQVADQAAFAEKAKAKQAEVTTKPAPRKRKITETDE